VQKHTNSQCEYVEVTCKYLCGENIARCHLASHESDLCPQNVPMNVSHCGHEGHLLLDKVKYIGLSVICIQLHVRITVTLE